MKSSWKPPTPILFLVLVVVAIGVVFRFAYLDRKLVWIDETHTGLWISGHSWIDLIQEMFTGQVVSAADLQRYQQPNSDRGVWATVRALAQDFPEHPPLYYAGLRVWLEAFGGSIAAVRSFSAVISLLTFPAIYWFCIELFGSALVAWVAVALVAVSPIHVLYAQEARQYCLWIVMTLVSSAALLRATRLPTKLNWGVYAVTVALSLYTYLFSALVLLGHGIYLVVTQKYRLSKPVIAYVAASAVGTAAFAPWLWVILQRTAGSYETMQSWMGRVSWVDWAKRWAGFLSRLFFDVGLDSADALSGNRLALLPVPFLLVLIGYAVYRLCRRTPRTVWLLVVLLIGLIPLVLGIHDARSGGVLSSTARYLFPCFLGVQLAVAYWLATQLVSAGWRQKLGQVVLVALLSAGVFSCSLSSQATLWWSKGSSTMREFPVIASIVNSSSRPLVIANEDTQPQLLVLSYLMQPNVRFQLTHSPQIPVVPDGYSAVFAYQMPDAAMDQFKRVQGYTLEAVPDVDEFWRLTKNPLTP
ncbi:glycosyltransferase family 39 protein [Leptolyngbya sp. FACHB-36]|uniref:glycosyltransferase family 39 protein n=1 Tax=Leptolyngbya sp. FACHB-36 TaxID=2692808 RepID=UPI0016812708|nr:glycosyltransferase family 39 protein [Leptolyngbya sp. FACHB-36]MBD2020638.1 glycosyltransferase family 39 protein [Leptolyngbya sp. FACHB-36]